MKLIPAIFLLIIFGVITYPFDDFIQKIPNGWSYKIKRDILTLSFDSAVRIQYCDYSPIRNEPISNLYYEMEIEYSSKFSDNEVNKRKHLQDSILGEYQRQYDLEPNKLNYGRVQLFKFKKNMIDSLRTPFYSNDKFSYFFRDNLPNGYCIVDDSSYTKIESFKRAIKKKK